MPPPSCDDAPPLDPSLAARSARIRSNSTDAGSSDGSCGTSRPSNAAFSTDRRSAAERARPASTARSHASMNENCRSTSATMRRLFLERRQRHWQALESFAAAEVALIRSVDAASRSELGGADETVEAA